jgi:AcrR family transcriptional regulator
MAPVKRQRLGPAERRAQLVEVGLSMLEHRAIEQISVDEVAARVGVSKALFFHYFPTKHDFHLAVVTKSTEEMLERTQLPDLSDMDPVDAARLTIERFLDYVIDNHAMYVSLLRGPASGDPDMQAIALGSREVMTERALAVVRLFDVELTPSVRLSVRGWIGYVEEVVTSWLANPEITRDEWLDLVVRVLQDVVAVSRNIPSR